MNKTKTLSLSHILDNVTPIASIGGGVALGIAGQKYVKKFLVSNSGTVSGFLGSTATNIVTEYAPSALAFAGFGYASTFVKDRILKNVLVGASASGILTFVYKLIFKDELAGNDDYSDNYRSMPFPELPASVQPQLEPSYAAVSGYNAIEEFYSEPEPQISFS